MQKAVSIIKRFASKMKKWSVNSKSKLDKKDEASETNSQRAKQDSFWPGRTTTAASIGCEARGSMHDITEVYSFNSKIQMHDK